MTCLSIEHDTQKQTMASLPKPQQKRRITPIGLSPKGPGLQRRQDVRRSVSTNTQYLRKVTPDDPLLEVDFSLEGLANLSLEVSRSRPSQVETSRVIRSGTVCRLRLSFEIIYSQRKGLNLAARHGGPAAFITLAHHSKTMTSLLTSSRPPSRKKST